VTRAAWPAAFGRGRAAPLQVDVPQRLPGGLWGPQPISGTVAWDNQGAPINPATGSGVNVLDLSLADTSQALLQAEWPIPTRFELQLGLSLSCVAGGPASWNAAAQAFTVLGSIEGSVESATVTQVVSLPFGPGAYPLLAAINGVPGLSTTFPVIAQVVRVRLTSVRALPDLTLAGQTWAWTVNAVCGLTSAGWPG